MLKPINQNITLPKIYFTVTNDLNFDQRMQRICTSLNDAGYEITLIGSSSNQSAPLQKKKYRQKRISVIFKKGKLFYLEYNIRLFFFMLFKKIDGICAIDLDTIIPCYYISKFKNIPRIHDAHELFCEMKEVVSRPFIYKVWKFIETTYLPSFQYGYTVNHFIAQEFKKKYNIDYKIIRNLSSQKPFGNKDQKEKFILYQGAVNEGRCFEYLIPAMKNTDAKLVICGEGNYLMRAKILVRELDLNDKVEFMGKLLPDELALLTKKAYIGITLFEKQTKNNFWSLANRFFDYIHAGTPQICVSYPAYSELNKIHQVAVLIKEYSASSISSALNELLNNDTTWEFIHENCRKASKEWNWENEEMQLIDFYNNIFGKTLTYRHS